MPILRYFLYVGGALLSLLLISSVVLPQVPLPSALTSASDLPPVRIHSDRKLPERIVFDTRATVPPDPVAVIASAKAAPGDPVAAAVPFAEPEISPKARVREAFAQLPEAEAARVAATQPKIASKALPKRKIAAGPRAAQPSMLLAQQPRFGQTTW